MLEKNVICSVYMFEIIMNWIESIVKVIRHNSIVVLYLI